MAQNTVADVMVQQLVQWGVERVYGVAGDANLVFLDALAKHPSIKFIQARHETAAAFMASAEAKLTGRVGVCTGTNGPGLVNMLNGLGDPYADKVPVLAITGQIPSYKLGLPVKQAINEQVMIQPLALWSSLLCNPQRTAELTWLGLHYATSMGGVTHLSVLKDLWEQPGGQKIKQRPKEILSGHIDKDAFQEIIDLCQKAAKPVIMVGRGIQSVLDDVKKLAEGWQVPVITTLPAKGFFPEDYELSLGCLGQAGTDVAGTILKESDLVLILGATWWPEEFTPENIPIIQIDVVKTNLALTHPAVQTLNVYLEDVLPILIENLTKIQHTSWLERVKLERERWQNQVKAERETKSSPLMPQFFMAQLEKMISSDTIIVLDVGDHVIWYARSFWGSNRDLLISGTWRSMAFGLPAAIAAKLVYPKRNVVCITGDGGLTMNLGELLTAVQHQASVKLMVINNNSLGMEENRAISAGLIKEGVKLLNPDFVQVAQACGWQGAKAKNPQELNQGLEACFNSTQPFLLDVQTALPMPPHTML